MSTSSATITGARRSFRSCTRSSSAATSTKRIDGSRNRCTRRSPPRSATLTRTCGRPQRLKRCCRGSPRTSRTRGVKWATTSGRTDFTRTALCSTRSCAITTSRVCRSGGCRPKSCSRWKRSSRTRSSSAGARRSLADHVLGEDMYHTHDDDTADHDHDHDHFDLAGRTEDDPLWQADHVELTSVGIDIGSAGTQVVCSRLAMQRMSEELSSRYHVVSRETLHRSPVALTPYKDDRLIDERALAAIIDDAYGAAGVHPDDVDTGVVILTGEALRRENAKTIADVLADAGGEFVCASAGHHMEAMLAAFGSGAAKASHDRGERLLNVDIGGGTTKLAIVERGKIIATAALHIGGRLLVVDAHRRIVRLEPAGRKLAAAAGFDWSLGDVASDADVATVAQFLADTLIAAIIERPLAPALDALYLTEPIDTSSPIAGVMFSGGVAEYVYRREARDFGDWGRELGAAIAAAIDAGRLPWPMLPAGECIRATALGASEYSVQLSGNTCYISAPGSLLPRRNLQVLQPPYVCEA